MYRQITVDERYTLEVLRQLGYPGGTIARALGRHRSTIWREVRRNATQHDGSYRPELAHWYATSQALPLPAQSAVHRGRLPAGAPPPRAAARAASGPHHGGAECGLFAEYLLRGRARCIIFDHRIHLELKEIGPLGDVFRDDRGIAVHQMPPKDGSWNVPTP